MHRVETNAFHVIVSDFVSGHENRSRVTLFDDTNAISFLFNSPICHYVTTVKKMRLES